MTDDKDKVCLVTYVTQLLKGTGYTRPTFWLKYVDERDIAIKHCDPAMQRALISRAWRNILRLIHKATGNSGYHEIIVLLSNPISLVKWYLIFENFIVPLFKALFVDSSEGDKLIAR